MFINYGDKESYKDLAVLMRDLMFKWKNTDGKIVKEISMPDMIDIMCRYDSKYIDHYWEQINESPDPMINTKLDSIIQKNRKVVSELYGMQPFTSNELQRIISTSIKDIGVLFI